MLHSPIGPEVELSERHLWKILKNLVTLKVVLK